MTALPSKLAALLALAAASAAHAQPVTIDASYAPLLVGPDAAPSVFQPVSAPEVLARPAVQRDNFGGGRGPTDNYAGPAAELLEPWKFPLSKLQCCEGEPTGRPCRVDRYRTKPVGIDPDCLICVKEPYVAFEPVKEQVEAVIFQCFETEVPFADDGCEDGTWYKKQGKKVIRRLRPCTVKVNLNYEKKVVRYHDVWYHIRCD